LNRTSQGREPEIDFGKNQSLVRWASIPEVGIVRFVAGKWMLASRSLLPPGGYLLHGSEALRKLVMQIVY
jgi:hypothetical protein